LSTGTTTSLAKAQEVLGQIKSRQQLLEKGVLSKFNLDGKVALVTGAGQGIGEALAHGLGEAGCKVAVCDLEYSRVERVAADLEAKGIPALAVKVDVSNKADVDAMVQTILDKWGDLDIACNNAGIVYSTTDNHSVDIPQTQWERTMAVNLNGVFYCCQAEGRHMLKKGRGKIINTASMSATIVNHPQIQAAYNASKAGCVHMTKSLAAEWADRGVNVNSLSPGYADTALNRTEALTPIREQWIRETPAKRLADVQDLVGAIIYLASPLSDFCQGLDLIVDGGFTLW
jgi:NAD(P)-dependent dehydrogenase (short-subunit alcohol dehydrogenase family)